MQQQQQHLTRTRSLWFYISAPSHALSTCSSPLPATRWMTADGCHQQRLSRSKRPAEATDLPGAKFARVESADETAPTTQTRCGTINGSGHEPKNLSDFVMAAEDALGQRSMWCHKFQPMVVALKLWNAGGSIPTCVQQTEFATVYNRLLQVLDAAGIQYQSW